MLSFSRLKQKEKEINISSYFAWTVIRGSPKNDAIILDFYE